MAIVIREPRNPLADALGTLSQQILADAASRKEREFRSAEMEKERGFRSAELGKVREFEAGQAAEDRAARAVEFSAENSRLREQGLAMIERDKHLADKDAEWRKAHAAALASGNAAEAKYYQSLIDQNAETREMLKPLVQGIVQRLSAPTTTSGGGRGVELAPPFIRRQFEQEGLPAPITITPQTSDSLRTALINAASPTGTGIVAPLVAAFTPRTTREIREGLVASFDPEAYSAADSIGAIGERLSRTQMGKEVSDAQTVDMLSSYQLLQGLLNGGGIPQVGAPVVRK